MNVTESDDMECGQNEAPSTSQPGDSHRKRDLSRLHTDGHHQQCSGLRPPKLSTREKEYFEAKASFAHNVVEDEVKALLLFFPKISRATKDKITSGEDLWDSLEAGGYIDQGDVTALIDALKNSGLCGFAKSLTEYASKEQYQGVSGSENSYYVDKFKKTITLLTQFYMCIISRLAITPWLRLPLDEFFVALLITKAVHVGCQGSKVPLDDYAEMLAFGGFRTLILGDAGVGKTMLTLKLVHDWIKKELTLDVKLILLLRLRHLSSESKTLVEAVFSCLAEGEKLTSELMEQFIEEQPHKVLIVIDGWDEFPRELIGKAIHTHILKIMEGNKFPLVKVIITSRPSALSSFKGDWKEHFDNILEIAGFTVRSAKEFIQQKFFKTNYQMGMQAIEHLERNGLFDYIGIHPLLLTLTCGTMDFNKKYSRELVPKTFTTLFKNVFKWYEHHLREKNKKEKMPEVSQERITSMMRCLGSVAWSGMIVGPKLFWKADYIQEKIGQENFELSLKIGILQVESDRFMLDDTSANNECIPFGEIMATEGTTVAFPHRLFQEYMAGLHLSEAEEADVLDALRKIRLEENAAQIIEEVGFVLRFASGLNSSRMPNIVTTIYHNSNSENELRLSSLIVQCLHECYGATSLPSEIDSSVKNVIRRAVQSLNVQYKIEEKGASTLFSLARSTKIPLRLRLVCNRCDPQGILPMLIAGAELLFFLEIWDISLELFAADESLPTVQLSKLRRVIIEQCDLSQNGAIEGILRWVLKNAPNIREIKFSMCKNMPESVAVTDDNLQSLLKLKSGVHIIVVDQDTRSLHRERFCWYKKVTDS